MNYDVIIIGAGMSGLAAGIRLAHFGKKVAIFEKHSLVGGLNSFYRRQGHDFEVGLHAMTNFVGPGDKRAPLNKLLRQLRIKYDDLGLCPQHFSLIRFPGSELKFTNDFDEFVEEVARHFPDQIDGFRRLVARITEQDMFSLSDTAESTRSILKEYITDPLLQDMILCPVMFYGNPSERDMDFTQFCIMFRSVFMEGFCRPHGGVRHILNLLLQRYQESGGELRMKCGVRSLNISQGSVAAVELDDGTTVTADRVLSSAGFLETMQLCNPTPEIFADYPAGQLSFVETIFILDRTPDHFGLKSTIVFENDSEAFSYAKPDCLVDERSSVICIPNNFALPGEEAEEGMLRITHIADYEKWSRLSNAEYQQAKDTLLEAELKRIDRLAPGIRDHVTCTDMFTPKTITRFTGHINGAVYGSPLKAKDGTTPVSNLFLCGTDQGFLGITGSMLSGVSIANTHLLI